MTIQFVYNGTFRMVKIVKETNEYIQGENLPCNGLKPNRPFSTYDKNKMERLLRLPLTA